MLVVASCLMCAVTIFLPAGIFFSVIFNSQKTPHLIIICTIKLNDVEHFHLLLHSIRKSGLDWQVDFFNFFFILPRIYSPNRIKICTMRFIFYHSKLCPPFFLQLLWQNKACMHKKPQSLYLELQGADLYKIDNMAPSQKGSTLHRIWKLIQL